MKYFVVATKWSDKHNCQIKFIAGSFDRFIDASLFREAYEKHYSARAGIVEALDLVNAFYEN